MSEVVEMDIKSGQLVASVQAWGAGSGTGRSAKLKQRLPTFSYLEKAARRRIPGFAFDFLLMAGPVSTSLPNVIAARWTQCRSSHAMGGVPR